MVYNERTNRWIVSHKNNSNRDWKILEKILKGPIALKGIAIITQVQSISCYLVIKKKYLLNIQQPRLFNILEKTWKDKKSLPSLKFCPISPDRVNI